MSKETNREGLYKFQPDSEEKSERSRSFLENSEPDKYLGALDHDSSKKTLDGYRTIREILANGNYE